MRQYYIQSKACNSIPFGMAKMTPDYFILVLLYYSYSNTCTLPNLSVQLLHVDVSLSEHSDQKVRLHALGQTVCQLSASVNPFDLISCWLVKEWIEPVVLPGSHMRLPMCIRYLGSVQAKHTHIYKLFIYTPWCGTSTYAHTK